MPEPISEADVRHVAKLARLKLSDAQVAHFTEQLAHILGHIDKLQEVDVEGVEPMAHALDLRNALREDAEKPGLTPEQALANAPDADDTFFKVPKVLGEGPGA